MSALRRLIVAWCRKPAVSSEEAKRMQRVQMRVHFDQDTARARKLAWLKTLRPRLRKGDSGVWWCFSEHKTPQHISAMGTKVYVRVGCGDTLCEAYDSWLEF